ncbi:MAG: shikimate dehydrogenase family protein [Geminicoccales bacterium]
MSDVQLGLIGDNIARSQTPRLHRLAGELCGVEVAYDLLIPKDMGLDFDQVFARCAKGGFRGINVTYPYKERATAKVEIDNPLVRDIGAVNTIVFTQQDPRGFNTDYSGFIAAYRGILGSRSPGVVCLIGAGGVGKAVGFGLVELGLEELRIVERDLAKAEGLATALSAASPNLKVMVTADAAEGAAGASGLINCTPLGMVGYEGTPLPGALMKGAEWAFDAVYTPVDTQFLKDAEAKGLTIISGYELFFFQGVGAWGIFVGKPLDQKVLRAALARSG